MSLRRAALALLVATALAYGIVHAFAGGALSPREHVAAAMALGAGLALVGTLGRLALRGLRGPPPAVRLPPEERVLGSLPASHWEGLGARGGRLFVTDAGLHFTPHRFNLDRHTVSVPWAEVRGLGPVADGATGGLEVTTRGGALVFVVPDAPRSLELLLRVAEARPEDRPRLTSRLDLRPEPPDRAVLTA